MSKSLQFGVLKESNAEEIAQKMREVLDGKRFAIAVAHDVDAPNTRIELSTSQRLVADWTDGSEQTVRAMERDGGGRWLGFSAGGYFWPLSCGPDDAPYSEGGEHPYFSFEWGSVSITYRAPNGSLHRAVFKVEQEPDMLRSASEDVAAVLCDLRDTLTADKMHGAVGRVQAAMHQLGVQY